MSWCRVFWGSKGAYCPLEIILPPKLGPNDTTGTLNSQLKSCPLCNLNILICPHLIYIQDKSLQLNGINVTGFTV